VKLSDVYHHSIVIASDYRIPDPSSVGPLLNKRRAALADMGAHHALVYHSIRDHGRVLVMIGLRSRAPVEDLLRSGVFHNWFDAVGVADIPAVFAGEIIDRFDLGDAGEELPPGVLVSAIVSVGDVGWLISQMDSARAQFKDAGVRKVWVFQAFDDPNEVMIMQELDSEASARRWVKQHDASADWMGDTGIGVYPPLFIGEFVEMVRVEDPAIDGDD
jgi:hypothetical protein